MSMDKHLTLMEKLMEAHTYQKVMANVNFHNWNQLPAFDITVDNYGNACQFKCKLVIKPSYYPLTHSKKYKNE